MKFENFEKDYSTIENTINEFNKDLINYSQNIINASDLSKFFDRRKELRDKIFSIFYKFKDNNPIKEKATKYIIQYYSPYFEINPYELDKQFFHYFLEHEKMEITTFLKKLVEGDSQDNLELNKLYNNLIKRIDNLKLQYIKKETEATKELKFKIPVQNLYNLLLDFSEVLPLGIGSDSKTDNSTDMDYTLKTYFGMLRFKITEKDVNKRIVYEYDFLKSDIKEKGKLYLDFINLDGGKVNLRIRNEIHESSSESEIYINWVGNYLKQWIDYNMGKIVAEQIHTIIYEKSFDDLTIGNYRILQAKLNVMGEDIEKLKAKYFEVKAPLTLTSFNCSECGANLNIKSTEEKFIICEYCRTPFLMLWQK